MSIMTDARLRLLEARVAEIERRLVEAGAAALGNADGPGPKPAANSKPRISIQKTPKRTRKTS